MEHMWHDPHSPGYYTAPKAFHAALTDAGVHVSSREARSFVQRHSAYALHAPAGHSKHRKGQSAHWTEWSTVPCGFIQASMLIRLSHVRPIISNS